MTKLAIYGAGGLGREVLILAQCINQHQSRWNEIVFIDDFHPNSELKGCQVKSLSGILGSDTEVVIAAGEPATRKELAEKVRQHQLPLATLIHPNVTISECTTVGKGAVICSNVFVSCDVAIGENVYLQPLCSIGHDCVIGDNTVISTYVALGGSCYIGAQTFIGMSAVVQQQLKIGSNSIISMGAIVFSDIQDGVIALGNPARVMRKNDRGGVFK